MSKNYKAIILAAGQGKRMMSDKPKVLHEIMGKTLVSYVIDATAQAEIDDVAVIIGRGADEVRGSVLESQPPDLPVSFFVQEEQLGTGHAVKMADAFLSDNLDGDIVVLCGDTPLIQGDTLKALIKKHREEGNAATVISAIHENPTGYGRIIRDADNDFIRIVEQRDADENQRNVKEINTGIYCYQAEALKTALDQLQNNNDQKEYYLTDTLGDIKAKGGKIGILVGADETEFLGINSRGQLAEATAVLQQRINHKMNDLGVTLMAPQQTYIASDVIIGQDTFIYPGTILEKGCVIGEKCTVGPNAHLKGVKVGKGTTVQAVVGTGATIGEDCVIYTGTVLETGCVIGDSAVIGPNCHLKKVTIRDHATVHSTYCEDDTVIGAFTRVGPSVHLRPHADVRDYAKIGNFVEIKGSIVGEHSSVAHLSYIGDTEIGDRVNMGGGVVTVNYDGKNKYKTIIEDDAFVGCNSNLIAPVTIKEGAYVAAGSTITDDVPEYQLAIARARQVNKETWNDRRKKS